MKRTVACKHKGPVHVPKPGAEPASLPPMKRKCMPVSSQVLIPALLLKGEGGGRITSPEPEGYIHETDQRWDFYQRSDHANESLPGIQPKDCDCKAITSTLSLSNTRARPPYTGFVQVGFPDT